MNVLKEKVARELNVSMLNQNVLLVTHQIDNTSLVCTRREISPKLLQEMRSLVYSQLTFQQRKSGRSFHSLIICMVIAVESNSGIYNRGVCAMNGQLAGSCSLSLHEFDTPPVGSNH